MVTRGQKLARGLSQLQARAQREAQRDHAENASAQKRHVQATEGPTRVDAPSGRWRGNVCEEITGGDAVVQRLSGRRINPPADVERRIHLRHILKHRSATNALGTWLAGILEGFAGSGRMVRCGLPMTTTATALRRSPVCVGRWRTQSADKRAAKNYRRYQYVQRSSVHHITASIGSPRCYSRHRVETI